MLGLPGSFLVLPVVLSFVLLSFSMLPFSMLSFSLLSLAESGFSALFLFLSSIGLLYASAFFAFFACLAYL